MVKQVDISGHRFVSLEEVAVLFGMKARSLKNKVFKGEFPIKPKAKYPLRWSSAELREWFEDARRRA
jgi:predicted DNA-binding transcriptional regulator AlpA